MCSGSAGSARARQHIWLWVDNVKDDLIQAGLFLTFCLLLLFLGAGAQAAVPPADLLVSHETWPECLDRDLNRDMRAAGAEPWEIECIEAVAHGRVGRDLVTFTPVSCGSAGCASFAPGRLGLNMGWVGDCAWRDRDWRWRMLMVLYSDASAAVQLAAFRRISGRAIEIAHRNGFPRPLAAVLANAGPNRFLAEGEACGWDRDHMVRWYVSRGDKERRLHRVEQWL